MADFMNIKSISHIKDGDTLRKVSNGKTYRARVDGGFVIAVNSELVMNASQWEILKRQ